jgi:hypothetical protein
MLADLFHFQVTQIRNKTLFLYYAYSRKYSEVETQASHYCRSIYVQTSDRYRLCNKQHDIKFAAQTIEYGKLLKQGMQY